MPAVSEKNKIAFFGVPKVASTSLKQTIYEIEHGVPFFKKEAGVPHIHRFYPTVNFDQKVFDQYAGYWRFTVIRDPIARIISAYYNRIVLERTLTRSWKSRWRTLKSFVNAQPSLNQFCENLYRYRRHPSVMHHTNLIHNYVGENLEAYDAVFRIEDLASLKTELHARTEVKFDFPHSNKTQIKSTFSDLDEGAQISLLEYAKPEYDMLRGRYVPPKVEPK